jgi:hypothetical protein
MKHRKGLITLLVGAAAVAYHKDSHANPWFTLFAFAILHECMSAARNLEELRALHLEWSVSGT